jgi:hypothetical protein
VGSSLVAVELNDAGLRVARSAEGGLPVLVGEESPGIAMLHEGRVLTGADAALRQRFAPLHVQQRYWQALDVQPLPWQARGIATAADLAHAHLSSVLAPVLQDGSADLLLAVPPGYSREQLGLLVGIANECGGSVRGLVDLGLAACADAALGSHTVHLDLQLHQAVLTVLEAVRSEGTLRRSRYELLPGVGVVALQNALAARIAAEFVAATRFDPLHEAATEQRLHESLPDWLASLGEAETVDASLEFGATTHTVVLQRAQMADAVAPLVDEWLGRLHAARPAGAALQLCLSPRAAAVPGLIARLATLRDCVLVQLPVGAAALGALRQAAHIVRPPESIALVHRLPLAGAGAAASLGETADARMPGGRAVPADAVPTHVLFRGRAWPITSEPLELGWSVGQAARALTVPAGIPGVSRSHCTLRLSEGQAWVTDHSTYGTFVNDDRVGGGVALRVGDSLRLGTPGIVLELIHVLPR